MADETKPSFEELSDQAKEAVTPRGEYMNPEALDQGTGYPGAPKGGDTPESIQTDPGVDPADQKPAAEPEAEPSEDVDGEFDGQGAKTVAEPEARADEPAAALAETLALPAAEAGEVAEAEAAEAADEDAGETRPARRGRRAS